MNLFIATGYFFSYFFLSFNLDLCTEICRARDVIFYYCQSAAERVFRSSHDRSRACLPHTKGSVTMSALYGERKKMQIKQHKIPSMKQ